MSDLSIDNHKLMYHPRRVAEWLKNGDCYPIYVEIGPTNSCNHRCSFCALDFLKRGKDYINKEIMISSLKEMAEKGVKSIMFAGEGEPLLHKEIGLFVKSAKENRLDISITSNGILFSEKKIEECLPYLSWIRFSIDAGNEETYSKIHGTNKKDFYKIMDNLEKSVIFKNKNKLKTSISCQFLAIPQNINEVEILAKRLKDIGVDNLQIKPYSFHPDSLNNLIVNLEEYNQLEERVNKFNSQNFKIILRKKTAERINKGIDYKECYGLPFFTLINSKGDVFPCNLYYNKPEFIYGNLYRDSFSKIWGSERRKDILNKIKNKGTNDCRVGCRLDPINRYLNRLKTPDLHDKFI